MVTAVSRELKVREWDDGVFATSDAASTVVKDLLGLTSMVLEHRVTVDQIRAAIVSVLPEPAPAITTAGSSGLS